MDKPAPAAPAAPAPAPAEPMTEPADDAGFGDFGGEEADAPAPEEAPADDAPFDKEPFDAGVDADEETDPKKFIEQLSGKLGQSLRSYSEETGQPDFDLEKFAINSVISATHTSEMDENDRKDIIKKLNSAGKDDAQDSGSDNQDNTDFGNDTQGGPDDGAAADDDFDFSSDEEDLGENSYQIYENEDFFLENPKRMSIFAPEGSPEFMEENRLNEACWKGYKKDGMKTMFGKKYPNCVKVNEDEVIEEKKDACYHKVKARYDVWPSAYASGALVKCRKVGAANWGNKTDEGEETIEEAKTDFSKEKESGLHGWFSRKGGEGSQGWVDCNTCRKDPDTGAKKCKPCGRKDGEERSKYPSCRPTPGSCKAKGKGESWGKKSTNESELFIYENIEENMGETNNYMFWLNLKGIHDDAIEMLHMDHSAVDKLICDGHQWALEHVITSKDDIEEVYHFLEGNMEADNMMESDMGESNNYMFWSSLKTIAHASGELLEMDTNMVDRILSNGHGWALDHIATANDDMEEVYHFLANTLNAYDGDTEHGYEDEYGNVEHMMDEGKYDGKPLGKPMKGDVKKFKVYVRNKKGNVIKVNFGDPNMEIKRDDPKRRKSFRARHKCAQAKDRTKPKYWSCKMWSKKPVSKIVEENLINPNKFSIFDKTTLLNKLHESLNQDNMNNAEPQTLPAGPKTKPSETQPVQPTRRQKTFLPEIETQPDPKAKK